MSSQAKPRKAEIRKLDFLPEMSRRKQFQGIANSLTQWILSRNFDSHGYWAVGKLYKFSKEQGVSQVVLDLKLNKTYPESIDREFDSSIKLLYQLLQHNMKSSKMPESWLEEATVTLFFNVPYQRKYHHWRSALGEPFICSANIKTDLHSIYTSENGGNCWVHNPEKELRRYGM